ncbi:MAG: PTS sugar transporter subunit IIB [Calditrichia bacterium]|nr:PTS sugar transporter subunit IIB [Calditrichia bacterium]MCK5454945.1 PTS sugar transporter subunit IIB [Calditrichia bacterium]
MKGDKIIWRIDDRLIHGQVIIGWCGQLPITRLAVIDKQIAKNSWEKELLLMAAPPNLPAEILTVEEITQKISPWTKGKEMILVLLKSPELIKELKDAGVDIKKVNVGGMHFRDDRRELLSYLYLSSNEIKLFEELMEQGIHFECQDLPTSTAYDLKKIIQRKK